jgi:uncharacterized protein YgbK (DUF1537 family)
VGLERISRLILPAIINLTLGNRYNAGVIPLSEPQSPIDFVSRLAALAPIYPDDGLLAKIQHATNRLRNKIVVLDDDPTGSQAMRDVYVLTEWTVETLERELREPRPLFFMLTNTRSMSTAQAIAFQKDSADKLREASRRCGIPYALMIRGDSTLRGHFPEEEAALGPFDGILLVPFFEEGGRYTIDDVQWVREAYSLSGDVLVPVAQTPYAHDQAFVYRHSNLRNWAAEKTNGRHNPTEVEAISIETLRLGGPDAVAAELMSSRRQITIANAAAYRDLEVLALGLLAAESAGKRFVVRCAASFVRVRAGQGPPPMGAWIPADLGAKNRVTPPDNQTRGGLMVVGSHVPKTSSQLHCLLRQADVVSMELLVPELLAGNTAEVTRVGEWVNARLAEGYQTVVYTTRDVEPRGREGGLVAGQHISDAIVNVVRSLQHRPRFIIAKGGWTASAIGTKALGARRAYAPQPIVSGVPQWILGGEARFPGLPFVVFPGNVGHEDTLANVVKLLAL